MQDDGKVVVLGSNTLAGHSPLGNFSSSTPVAGASSARVVSGLTSSSVSAAELYALAVGTDGRLYGWGTSNGGTLGVVVNGYVDIPTALPGLDGVTAAVATEHQAVALRSDGTVWYWPGVVSTSTTSAAVLPGQVAGLTDVRKITRGQGAGSTGTYTDPIAIKTDGTAWALAWSPTVVMGAAGPETTYTATARQITGLADVVDISCSDHCLALLGDGHVVAWGNNSVGQLGNGSVGPVTSNPLPTGGATVSVTPSVVPGLENVKAIATTINASVAIETDGSVWGWGGRDGNGLGTGDVSVATQVSGIGDAVDVSCAVGSPCVVLKSDGTIWGWGGNGNGELGDGTTTAHTTPVQATGIDLN